MVVPCVDFGLHFVGCCDSSVLRHLVHREILDLAASFAGIARLASAQRLALSVFGFVILASLARDSMLFPVSIDPCGVAPVATACKPAVDQYLWCGVDLRKGVLLQDVYPLGEKKRKINYKG